MTTNNDFRSWVRSASFSLTLNETAIRELLIIYGAEQQSPGRDHSRYGMTMYNRGLISYLTRRGLIRRCPEEGFEGNYYLTKAGTLTAELLVEAGFSVHVGCIQVPAECATSS